MVDGLWTIHFQTPAGWVGGGVVILEAGRLLGGDSRYYYVGTYVVADTSLAGSFRLRHHDGDDVTPFLARGRAHDARIQAVVEPNGVVITGLLVSATPGFSPVALRMTLQHDLGS